MNFPTLFKKTSTGAIQQWEIMVRLDTENNYEEEVGLIITKYGQVGGKQQQTVDFVREGKNTGKVNATTPVTQAVAEAKAQWEAKKKKGYVESKEDAQADKVDTNSITGGVDPMLAHTYAKQGHKIKWPAFVQPKLDGHRCIAIYQDGVCTLWSRTRKRITGVPHIARAIEKTFADSPMEGETIILDGELYRHKNDDFEQVPNFEDLSSFIRSVTPKPGHEVVQYWIYDLVAENMPFSVRNKMLSAMEELAQLKLYPNPRYLEFVMTAQADSEEDMTEAFGIFVAEGFEGLMVRNADSLYKGKRSYDLLKVKTMEDSEFMVTGIEEGRGKMAGKALFVCEAPNGRLFRCKMKGALDDLKGYFNDPEPWIGRQLTVQYQGLTADGLPRFPVGLRFREDV